MREFAALACLALVAFLFWRDLHKQGTNPISWAPFFWMAIAGSRFVSAWLNLRGPGSVSAYDEGSPVDRLVFLCLLVWGLFVLYHREIDWARLFRQNKWLVAYFLYCLASIAWTDDPGILARRWFKDLGNPIMALVLLTELNPYDAIVTTVRRLAFVLLPISVLFIRYFPELGRGYAADGGLMYSGIADQKNTLGLSCLIVGVCYASTLARTRRFVDRNDLVMAAMLLWLLYMANSQTSLICLLVAVCVLSLSMLQFISRRPARLIAVVLGGAAIYLGTDAVFHLQNHVLELFGRDPTFTNRTDVWTAVVKFQTNELVGSGFMSFWTGQRMAAVWAAVGAPLNQAHNGYVEQYLNLGLVGVGFIVAIVIAGFVSVRKQLTIDYRFAVLRFCFLVAALLYNYTEASFYGISNMWVLFLAAAIDAGGVRQARPVALAAQAARIVRYRGSLPRRPLVRPGLPASTQDGITPRRPPGQRPPVVDRRWRRRPQNPRPSR